MLSFFPQDGILDLSQYLRVFLPTLVWWPVKWNQVVLGQEVAANSSNMRPGIFVLECQIMLLHKRNHALPEIWSLKCIDFKFPLTTIRVVLSPWAMPPHTITEPPPSLSACLTQASTNRSPRCRYKHLPPSTRYRVNHAPSRNRTCLQRCIVLQGSK